MNFIKDLNLNQFVFIIHLNQKEILKDSKKNIRINFLKIKVIN